MIRPFAVLTLAPTPTQRDRFRKWVAIYGVSRLGRSLTTDRKVIQTWNRTNKPKLPSVDTIRQIIALSTLEPLHDGPLSYEDFFGRVAIASTMHRSLGRVRKVANAPRTPLTRRMR